MDLRAQQYFKDEEAFHRGMKLFQQYVDAQTRAKTFDQMQSLFFDHLDDITSNDSALLDAAANYVKSKRLETDPKHGVNEIDASRLVQLLRRAPEPNTEATQRDQIDLPNSIKLSAACEEFLESRQLEWKKSGGMERDYRAVYFPLLLEVCGDTQVNLLRRQDIARYAKIVRRIPSNRNKKKEYKEKSLIDFETQDVPNEEKLSPVTLKRYLGQTSSFLKWIQHQGYINDDLTLPLKSLKIKTTRANERKSIYTTNDLRKLFNSEHYTKGLHERASHFWVPLLAIYTGARLNEICQLEIVDISFNKVIDRPD